MTSCGCESCSTGVSSSLFLCSPWHRDVKSDRCLGSERAACAVEHSLSHAICSYPSTGRACQWRPVSIEPLLSSLSWLCPPYLPLQCAIWCMALITTRYQAFPGPMYAWWGGVEGVRGGARGGFKHTPSAVCLVWRKSSCVSAVGAEEGMKTRGGRAQKQKYKMSQFMSQVSTDLFKLLDFF